MTEPRPAADPAGSETPAPGFPADAGDAGDTGEAGGGGGAGADSEAQSRAPERLWPPSAGRTGTLTPGAAADVPVPDLANPASQRATAVQTLGTTAPEAETEPAPGPPTAPEPPRQGPPRAAADSSGFDATTAVPVGPGRTVPQEHEAPADASTEDGLTAGVPGHEIAPMVEPARPTDARDRRETRNGPPAISMQGVTRRFSNLVAVEDLSLVVEPGAILGIIGPSGAGKTTTIRLLTGGLKPDRGTVRVLGEDPRRFRPRTRERIGYMPQQFLLYPDLTADENVDFVASLFGMLWWKRRRRVGKVLDIVGLLDARDRRASRLSGGMQRRLALACALVHDPAMLFLDEPTAGIDPLLRKSVWTELHRLRDVGRTLLVTTQYLNEAEECDAVALIAHGRLVALAPPDDLRREALGGEVIDIETTRTWDDGDLPGIPLVRAVRQIGPRRLLVVTEDAGAATPAVVEAVRSKGGDVASVREYIPSFDEVFAELVSRSEGDGSGTDPDSPVAVAGRRDAE